MREIPLVSLQSAHISILIRSSGFTSVSSSSILVEPSSLVCLYLQTTQVLTWNLETPLHRRSSSPSKGQVSKGCLRWVTLFHVPPHKLTTTHSAYQRLSLDFCVVCCIQRLVHQLPRSMLVLYSNPLLLSLTFSFVLDGLAMSGNAPKIFKKTSRGGLPYVSLIFCSLFACLAYMGINAGSGEVFGWFVIIIKLLFVRIIILTIHFLTGLQTWLLWLALWPGLVSLSPIFASTRASKRKDSTAPNSPITQICSHTLHGTVQSLASSSASSVKTVIFVEFWRWWFTLGTQFSGWSVFLKGNWDTATFVTNYLPLILFPILYIGWKIKTRVPIVKPADMDFVTGIDEIEADTWVLTL